MFKKHHVLRFVTVLLALLVCLTLFSPRIAQPLSYHNFADKREFFGIDYASDVLSNLFFLLFGVWGLKVAFVDPLQKTSKCEKVLWAIFFGSSIAVSLLSGYYHLDPDNFRLFFDRMAMSVLVMSFFSLMIAERVSPKIGCKIAPYLLILGVCSVIYWITTEFKGDGDLRPYAMFQMTPFAVLLPLIAFFPSIHKGQGYLYEAFVFYGLAKICENFDVKLFDVSGGIVSGHTLKHLLSSLSVFTLVLYLKKRKNH